MESKNHKSETKEHDLQMQRWKTLVSCMESSHKDLLRVGRKMNQARIKAEKYTWIWRLDLEEKWKCPSIVF